MSGPSPRSIAHALADAVKPRVITAQRYLDEWRAMATAGVPPLELRHALDRKVQKTQAVVELRAWNGRGALAFIGALECGKSHAAALWLLDGVRQGKACAWVSSSMLLSWTDVESAMGRATNAARFVFDDGGVGTISRTDGFAAKLEAVLHARHSKGRPSILTTNANRAHFEEIVGPRVLSRLKEAGEIVTFEHALDMRRPSPEEVDEETGHGESWARADALVRLFGCDPNDHFDPETGRVVQGNRVGDALDSRLVGLDGGEARTLLRKLAEVHGLNWRELVTAADRLEAQASSLAAAWGERSTAMAANGGDRSATMARIQRLAALDIAAGRKAPEPIAYPEPPPLREPKTWASKAALRELGFEVTRKRPGTRKLGATYRVTYKPPKHEDAKPAILHAGIRDEAEGWRIAAGLLEQDSMAPGTTSSPDYYQRTEAIRAASRRS